MTIPRQLKITYGSHTYSGTVGSSALTFLESHTFRLGPDDFEVGFEFVLVTPVATTLIAAMDTFQTDSTAVELNLRTHWQDFKLEAVDPATGTVRSTPILELKHSDNSGLEIEAEVDKLGGPRDTSLSRHYSVTIRGGLPATSGGRQRFAYELEYSPSRKPDLIVTGIYTAVSGPTQARAQYLSAIDARVSTITTALGGAWELVEEKQGPISDNDQTAEFTRRYRQVKYNQSSGVLNHAGIVDPTMTFSREKQGAEGSRDERKLAIISGQYTSAIDFDVVTDLQGLWTGTIKPWILTNLRDFADTTNIAVITLKPTFDPVENRLDAFVQALAKAGGDTITRIVTTEDSIDFGHIIRYVWPDTIPVGENDPTPAWDFGGPKKITRTITTTTTVLGKQTPPPLGGGGRGGGQIAVGFGGPRKLLQLGAPFENAFGGIGLISKPGESFLEFSGPGGGGGGAGGAPNQPTGGGAGGPRGVLISKTRFHQPGVRGIHPDQFDITDWVVTEVFEFIASVPRGKSGGATTGGSGADPGPTKVRAGGPRK